MGETPSLRIEGGGHLAVYQATIDGRTSTAMRHFCRRCGSHLWLWDPRWPDLVHPLASAIDTELPATPERVHLMLGSKPGWCPVPEASPQERHFDGYPEESDRGLAPEAGVVGGLTATGTTANPQRFRRRISNENSGRSIL